MDIILDLKLLCVFIFYLTTVICSEMRDFTTTIHTVCVDTSKVKRCPDGRCVSITDGCKADECGLGQQWCVSVEKCISIYDSCGDEPDDPDPTDPPHDYDDHSDHDLSSRTSLYYITIPLGVILIVSSIACRACKKTSEGQRRYHSWRQSFRESVTRRGPPRNGLGPNGDIDYSEGHMQAVPTSDPSQPGGYASMEACYPPGSNPPSYYEKTSSTYPAMDAYIPPGAPNIYHPSSQQDVNYPPARTGASPSPRGGSSPRQIHSRSPVNHSPVSPPPLGPYPISAHPPSYRQAIKTVNSTFE